MLSAKNVVSAFKGKKPDLAKGEFYAELDEESGLYCVFHTESPKAFASYADEGQGQGPEDEQFGQEVSSKWRLNIQK